MEIFLCCRQRYGDEIDLDIHGERVMRGIFHKLDLKIESGDIYMLRD
jgi:hypothetical protein